MRGCPKSKPARFCVLAEPSNQYGFAHGEDAVWSVRNPNKIMNPDRGDTGIFMSLLWSFGNVRSSFYNYIEVVQKVGRTGIPACQHFEYETNSADKNVCPAMFRYLDNL